MQKAGQLRLAKSKSNEFARCAWRCRERRKNCRTASRHFSRTHKVFVMFSNNHHSDGHVAVWLPVAEGTRDELVRSEPEKFYVPPYVGPKGWMGIELPAVSDDELGFYICEAHRLITVKKPRALR